MNYNLNPMGNYSYYPNYEPFNYICTELNNIYSELNNVNQRLYQLQSTIQRGYEDAIYNPNNLYKAPRFTHNMNEFGNGQGMINGVCNIVEYSCLKERESCLLYHKNSLENVLTGLQQSFNFPPYHNNLLW